MKYTITIVAALLLLAACGQTANTTPLSDLSEHSEQSSYNDTKVQNSEEAQEITKQKETGSSAQQEPSENEQSMVLETAPADQEYLQYINVFLSTRSFDKDHTEELDANVLLAVFDWLYTQSGQDYLIYEGHIPQAVIEDTLSAHLPLTAEEIRTRLQGFYEEDTETYRYQGGLGGAFPHPIITEVDHVDDTTVLYITFMDSTVDMTQQPGVVVGFSILTLTFEGSNVRYIANDYHPAQ